MANKLVIRVFIEDEAKNVIDSSDVFEREVKIPENIKDLGFTHKEQNKIITDTQQILLNVQTRGLITYTICPLCNSKLNKNGYEKTDFHGVISDHKVDIPKLICKNKSCAWSYNPSIKSHFGDKISPEFKKIQAELGATLSFRKAENSLNIMSAGKRPINNAMRTRRSTISCGEDISKYKTKLIMLKDKESIQSPNDPEGIAVKCTKSLVAVADGAYVHDAKNKGHNFEVMTAKVYDPTNVIQVSKGKNKITQKQCAASTYKDSQKTMKIKIVEAAKLENIDKNTKVYALADGAKNCWNVLKTLADYCGIIVYILDWYHIAQAFTVIENQLPKNFLNSIDTAHNALWYGEAEAAILCLKNLRMKLINLSHIDKLDGLINYLDNNKKYIVNYYDRMEDGLPFSSQAAESTVDHLVAERCKKKQKMAWNRESLHELLEVRSAIASNIYESFWEDSRGIDTKRAA